MPTTIYLRLPEKALESSGWLVVELQRTSLFLASTAALVWDLTLFTLLFLVLKDALKWQYYQLLNTFWHQPRWKQRLEDIRIRWEESLREERLRQEAEEEEIEVLRTIDPDFENAPLGEAFTHRRSGCQQEDDVTYTKSMTRIL